MKRILISSAVAVLGFTLLLGIAYPLAITGIAQVIPTREVVLAEATHVGDPRYFQPRPSQTDYSADATFFANRGPNSSSAKFFYEEQIAAYRAMNDGADPPMDAVTNSASGVDPDISHENAVIQARRIARVRNLPAERVLALVGDGNVNTTKLNEALDR
ncbi:potassium-transporting ATPase subunit C [Solirubrobacter taibaiensis]|nr:potassium-transporting ATPase subunit C [Solirubrobacter taibaiensis]